MWNVVCGGDIDDRVKSVVVSHLDLDSYRCNVTNETNNFVLIIYLQFAFKYYYQG